MEACYDALIDTALGLATEPAGGPQLTLSPALRARATEYRAPDIHFPSGVEPQVFLEHQGLMRLCPDI